MALGAPEPTGGDELESVGGIFADINITPLTDLFLVLLIIFMVTTTAIHESERNEGAFRVNLPQGGKGEEAAIARDLTVAILADGRSVIAGRVVDEPAMVQAFTEARERSAETVVLFQADEGVPHGRVVHVMELARRAGLARLAIGTRTEPPAR